LAREGVPFLRRTPSSRERRNDPYVAPISAITFIAPVKSIEPWKDTNKVVVNFAEPAREIGPIPLVKGGRVKALQNLRYTSRGRLETAKTLDDIW